MELTIYSLDRLFLVGERAMSDGQLGYSSHIIDEESITGMTYLDYIYFALSYVESTHISSLRFWFRLLDIDGEGKLSFDIIKHWYETMTQWVESNAMLTGKSSPSIVLPVDYFYRQFLDALGKPLPYSGGCSNTKDTSYHHRHCCDISLQDLLESKKGKSFNL